MFPDKKYSAKILLPVIILITFIAHFNSLNNGFQENWDDNLYVTQNPSLQNPGESYIKNAFTAFSNGHYHPITTLSYVMDYKLHGLKAKPFHITNLAIHILACIAVFIFIQLLVRNQFIAFFTALLFGIHPTHVESVAWISGRKDLLCTLFYVAALYTYLLYLNSRNRKHLIYTFMLFILALLSKSMAVTLPFILLLLDYFKERKINGKVVLEKAPFIVLSFIFGYVSVLAQKANNSLADPDTVSLGLRILFGCYALIMYIVKLFSFGNLSAFYNYPLLDNGKLPLLYYLMPLLATLLFFALIKMKKHKKVPWFGFGFFLITISVVLQFIPAGNVIMADRYTYLPYVGLFFIIASLADYYYKNLKLLKPIVPSAVFIYCILCAYVSFSRNKVWEDSMTLWTDTIEKSPDAALPYSNRAALYIQENDYQKAIVDLNKAIQIRPGYVTPHYNRGILLSKTGRYKEAVEDFNFVLRKNPRDMFSVFMERGNAYLY